jgi:hypothetical protein
VAVPAIHGRVRIIAFLMVTPRAFLARAPDLETEPADPLAWNENGGEFETRLWDDAAAVWWEPL